MYDTPRQALVELTEGRVLERVALAVLRKLGYPGLRLTSPSNDLGRDAYGRPWFGEHDEVVLLASCENDWSKKLDRDLEPYLARDRPSPRPEKAIFATTQPTNETTKEKRKAENREASAAKRGIALEILDLNELVAELGTDELHRVAEYELGVRPRTRRPLRSVAEFRERSVLPGATAPLVGREGEVDGLGELLIGPTTRPDDEIEDVDELTTSPSPRAPVVLLSGPAGIGKTRLAVDVAAERALTIIAPPSVSLTAEDLRDVPLNGRAVLIVDDAHRRPLAEIAALLSDPEYDQLALILTLRPGFDSTVEHALGLEPSQLTHLRLGPLSDEAIGAIVRHYGIEHESFQLHVRDLLDGNPLLTHAACATAVGQGQYTPTDAADIMRTFVERRLAHLEERTNQVASDRRRAAAVAVAVHAGAPSCDRDALAALRGSINTLPSSDDELEQVLLDLEETELVEDTQREDSTRPPAYVLRPDAAGPVVLADALTGQHRVRLRLDRALRALGRAAQFQPTEHTPDQRLGVLGLPVPPNQDEPELGLGLDLGPLGTQLSVLAQAAHLAADEPAQALLARAVRELLAPDADIAAWTDVLTLAAQVAPGDPCLVEWLHRRLITQWPPAPDLFSDVNDDADHHRSRIEQLVKETAEHAGRLARSIDAPPLVEWLLDTAWLAAAAIPERALDAVTSGFRALTGTSYTRTAESASALFARRRAALRAAIAWTNTRAEHDPQGLGAKDQGWRSPGLAVRIGLQALDPLLSLLTEELGPSLSGREHVSWRHYVLPDTPEASQLLAEAADAVIALLDYLLAQHAAIGAEQDEHANRALTDITKTPYTLLAERNRGFADEAPLPDYARTMLTTQAERLQSALAERWARLPLAARYVAAERAAILRGDGTLAHARDAADPIATRALTDEDLAPLLTVAPVDHFGLGAAGEEEQNQAMAVELGASTSLVEATAVLQALDEVPQSMIVDLRPQYGQAAGAAASDPKPLLEQLAQGRFPGDVWLLAGTAESHPEEVYDWLVAHLPDGAEMAELAVAVSGALPAAREATLLEAIFDTWVHSEAGPPVHLAEVLAYYLARHGGSVSQRLTRLGALGERGPAATVDTIFRLIAATLKRARLDGTAPLAESPELGGELVRVMRRVLAVADTEAFPHSLHDHDGALGAVALIRDAPEQTATLLFERATAQPRRPIPSPWRTLLRDAPLDDRRACGEALQTQLAAASELASEARQAAESLIRLLGGQP